MADGWLTKVRESVRDYLLHDPPSTGTTSGTAVLQDASASFTPNLVGRLVTLTDGPSYDSGDSAVNSYHVVSVDSPTQLTLGASWSAVGPGNSYYVESRSRRIAEASWASFSGSRLTNGCRATWRAKMARAW